MQKGCLRNSLIIKDSYFYMASKRIKSSSFLLSLLYSISLSWSNVYHYKNRSHFIQKWCYIFIQYRADVIAVTKFLYTSRSFVVYFWLQRQSRKHSNFSMIVMKELSPIVIFNYLWELFLIYPNTSKVT